MWARLSIVAGLLVGVAAAGLLLGGFLALAPETPLPSVAAPSAAPASDAPSQLASPLASPAATPSVAVPSAAAFHVGQPTPPLVVPQVGGGTIDAVAIVRDAALGRIGPDVKVDDPKSIMPGVVVTP